MQNLDFSDISFCGRIAYANCCIEEYITEQGDSPENWKILLHLLWAFPEAESMLAYWVIMTDRLPEVILNYDAYHSRDWIGQREFGNEVTEEEFYTLHKLYSESLLTKFINEAVWHITNMCGQETDGSHKEAEMIMHQELTPLFRENLKKLPDIEAFRIFSISRDVWDRFHTRDEIRLKFLENPDFQRK